MPRLMAAFFVSGMAALLCQIVWQRMLGIFAGSDTISAALVVGAFLAGLGVGSLLGARIADRLTPTRALHGFVACEAGVALCALASKYFLYDWLAVSLVGTVTTLPAVFALCFAGLVIPTTLMGASLPLLSRAVTTSLDTAAERIGTLYGLNTLGAGAGALLGGWVVVGHLGYVGALQVAAGLNLVAAALALTLRLPAPPPPAVRAAPAAPAPRTGSLALWCALHFLSGYVIVALEIVWVRLLGQVGQFHAYLFATVLGVFLLADGAGVAFAARLQRRLAGDPRPAFVLAQAGGFAVAILLLALLWLAVPNPPLDPLLSVDEHRFQGPRLLATAALTLLLVGPPAFLIGMTYPFVQRAVQDDLSRVGARVGWVQCANILGNAAGSILTGLLTFHLLGTMGTLRLLALLTLGLLLVALLAGWLPRPRARPLGWGLAAAAALTLVALPGNATFWRRLHNIAPGSFAALAEDRSGVALYRDAPADPGRERGRFFIAGFGQGRVPFLPGHILLGAVGPLVHPDPQRVLTIGVGSGGTPWGAAVNARTREIRGIELVTPVLDTLEDIATARPGGAVAALLADPRVRLESGDGRRLLVADPGGWDVIEADAILPESSHSGLLYSEEFLQQVRARLAPGGLYVQWAPSGRVVDTFAAVFPHVVLLAPFPLLIGSDTPIPFDHAALLARLGAPDVLAHARRGDPSLAALAPLIDRPPQRWGPETPRVPAPLTDLFPRDEFFANQDRVPVTHAPR